MTKEEILQTFGDINHAYNDCTKYDTLKRMLDELTESCNCINRQAVNDLIDELARAISDERCCISRGRSTATIMQDILHLPPVTPKMGYWSPIKSMGGTTIAIRCSCCGNSPKYRVRSNFCPNCGVKMEG